MKKIIINNVIIHIEDKANIHTLADRVNEFHVSLIEQRLKQSDLTREQKITVVDKVADALKSKEINGIIK